MIYEKRDVSEIQKTSIYLSVSAHRKAKIQAARDCTTLTEVLSRIIEEKLKDVD